MTIREQMRKRVRNAWFYTAVVGVGGAAGMAHYPLGLMLELVVGWGVISIAIIMTVMWHTRCPMCRKVMGAKTRAISKENPTLDQCPHCGVNFDQSLPAEAS